MCESAPPPPPTEEPPAKRRKTSIEMKNEVTVIARGIRDKHDGEKVSVCFHDTYDVDTFQLWKCVKEQLATLNLVPKGVSREVSVVKGEQHVTYLFYVASV
jgi:hypothetical protein